MEFHCFLRFGSPLHPRSVGDRAAEMSSNTLWFEAQCSNGSRSSPRAHSPGRAVTDGGERDQREARQKALAGVNFSKGGQGICLKSTRANHGGHDEHSESHNQRLI